MVKVKRLLKRKEIRGKELEIAGIGQALSLIRETKSFEILNKRTLKGRFFVI